MIKVGVISILLLIAFLFTRKSKALHGSIRQKRKRILNRLSGFDRD